MTASQSLQHLASEAELKSNAKRRSSRIPAGLSAKTYQQAPADEIRDGDDRGMDQSPKAGVAGRVS